MRDPTMVAASGAVFLVLMGIFVLARSMSERDLSRHIQRVVTGNDRLGTPRSARGIIVSSLRKIGATVQRLSVFSARDIAELERTARSAGFSPESTVPMVIGGKFVLMLSCPALAYVAARSLASPWPLICTCVGVAVGMFGPNALINYARRSRMKALRLGLSDALDLLVVCAEAGLGLESAIDRVATELRLSSPEVALEFSALGQDLRLSADRGAALLRMGDRTGLESFQRLTMTLSQTLRYGTPLGQALRILAIEMRNDRLLRLEERAARLPTLLMIPLAIFILPCLFIVVAGPAAMRLISLVS
jgi:tight adherence protein C